MHDIRGHILKKGEAVLSSAENAEIKKFFLLFDSPYYVLNETGPNFYNIGNDKGELISKQNVVNLKPYKSFKEASLSL